MCAKRKAQPPFLTRFFTAVNEKGVFSVNADLIELDWFKSSHSSGQSECVEVAWMGDGRVGVRDSKNPTGPALAFSPAEWDAFTAYMRG